MELKLEHPEYEVVPASLNPISLSINYEGIPLVVPDSVRDLTIIGDGYLDAETLNNLKSIPLEILSLSSRMSGKIFHPTVKKLNIGRSVNLNQANSFPLLEELTINGGLHGSYQCLCVFPKLKKFVIYNSEQRIDDLIELILLHPSLNFAYAQTGYFESSSGTKASHLTWERNFKLTGTEISYPVPVALKEKSKAKIVHFTQSTRMLF